MNYYRGNFYDDSEREKDSRNGWLVGYFADGLRNTPNVEVKFLKFKKGEATGHVAKRQKTAIECTFILKGKIVGEIDGAPIVLQAGDYVTIPAGVKSNYPTEVLEDFEALCIKSPSLVGDKII